MKAACLCRCIYSLMRTENSLEHYAETECDADARAFGVFMIYPSCVTAHPQPSVCVTISEESVNLSISHPFPDRGVQRSCCPDSRRGNLNLITGGSSLSRLGHASDVSAPLFSSN